MKTHILHLTNIVQLYCMMSHEIVLVFKSSDVLLRCLLRSVKYLKIYCVNYSFFKVILSNGKTSRCFAFMHLSDAFIQSDLQLHSGFTFSSVCVFPGYRTHNLFALLTQCSSAEPHKNTGFVCFLGETRDYQSYSRSDTASMYFYQWFRKKVSFNNNN